MGNTKIPYKEIIQWVESYCKRKKLGKSYKGLELSLEFREDVEKARKGGMAFFIDPMLPIDLVAVRSAKEPSEDKPGEFDVVHYYTLFWLVTSVEPSAESLQFYRFYLSRVSKLRAVKIIMIIPHNVVQSLVESLLRIAEENGFGLWRINTEQEDPDKLCIARHFRHQMEELLRNPPEDMLPLPDSVRKKAKRIGPYFDRYVGEAVEAVAGLTLLQVGKRYIARQILELALELEHISYAEELKDMVRNHLINKGDDYQFVTDTFSTLWRKYFPKMDYSKFLEISEFPLYNIFAQRKKPYRDHHMHQFQVFILGLAIIDKLLSKNHPDLEKCPNIDKQWLITASFHDMAYPLQLYDIWAKEFFEKSIEIPNIGVSDIKSYFIDRSLLSSLGHLINELFVKHFGRQLVGNWLYHEKELVLFLYDRITKLKHHSILSSLFLLKQAEKHRRDLLEDFFIPSALAITLHHYDQVWADLSKPKEKDKAWQNLRPEHKLPSLEFSTDPLSFLLMYCDHAQEWGRPKLTYPKPEEIGEEQTFVLGECIVQPSRCSVTIHTPKFNNIDENFEKKDTELTSLEKFVRRPHDCEFKITLVDKSNIERTHILKCTKEAS